MSDERIAHCLTNIEQSIGLVIDDVKDGKIEDAYAMLEELVHDANAVMGELEERLDAKGTK